jgi:hypothetical protein
MKVKISVAKVAVYLISEYSVMMLHDHFQPEDKSEKAKVLKI